MTKKKIVILGSTGSIGESALRVVKALDGKLEVLGLTTDRSIDKLALQVKQFKPKWVGIVNEEAYQRFIQAFGKNFLNGAKVFSGKEALVQVACAADADLVLSGVVGAVGLPALLAAIRMGRTVALANKESLIMAGELIQKLAKASGAKILPVDSEHSAMFQCLQGSPSPNIYKIILTASGGPFYRYRGDLSKVTVSQALAHPNWKMGKKITVDSATLMNKGLETIETHLLFGVPYDRIQIVIHPQSIIHSAVEFTDGSILAQLSHPDMCLPIQYALTYPERSPCLIQRLDFTEMKRLEFEKPDFRKFPCLALALEAGRAGGTMPAVLSAANEVAVYAFLRGKIRFTDIARVVEKVLSKGITYPWGLTYPRGISYPKHKKRAATLSGAALDLETILESDQRARLCAEEVISKL